MVKLLPLEYAVRNLTRSPARLIAGLIGSGLVVLLALAAAGFVRGMEKSLTLGDDNRNVLIVGAGSEESLERSEVDQSVAGLVAAAIPGIRTRDGIAYVSPEVQMAINIRLASDPDRETQAMLHGFTATAMLVHPQVRVIEGRIPLSGHDELMVGRLAAARVGARDDDLKIGAIVRFDNRDWTITGRFAAPRSVMEAEMWIPLADLQSSAKRNNLSCIVVTLDQATYDDVNIWCTQRLDLELVPIRESDYYAGLLTFYRPIRVIIWATAGLIALGGMFGALNTMYAAFASRVRELASLQTLGFRRRALLVSFLQESVLTASVGGLLGALIGLILLNGMAVRFSMGAFEMTLDAGVMLTALSIGLTLGIVGVLPPLWNCLRLPIVEGLRSG